VTVAEAVADWLAEKEIRHAFGIVGAGNLALWEAITRKGATEIVCTHHEQAAVMAASFYQRTCGKLSVALVTTGAGSTNAITGVMAAYMDSTPLIVISGNETAASLSGNTRVKGVQGYDSAKVAGECCKVSTRVWRPTDRKIKYTLNDLYSSACASRSGPVWLDLPRDVQLAPV
jgi:acetolactate synthase-1/2/3 large subunit